MQLALHHTVCCIPAQLCPCAPFLLVTDLFRRTYTGVCTASEKCHCYWKASFCCCQLEVSICWLWVHTVTQQQSMQTQWSLPNTYYMTCCFYSAVPDYAQTQGNTTHTVSTNPITGLSDVTFTYTVTSHWSSLAIVKSVYGQLSKQLTSGDTVVDALEFLFTEDISLLVSAVCSTFWLCICLWLVVCCAGMCMYTSMPCKALPNVWFPFLFWLWMHPGLVIVVKSTVKYTCRVALG